MHVFLKKLMYCALFTVFILHGCVEVEKISYTDSDPSRYIKIVDPTTYDPVYPSDPQYLLSSLWGLTNIDTEKAWKFNTDCTNILIGVIDSGVYYSHEDLAENIWVNPYEDLNNDGRCTLQDQDGIDQGGNGYIDDCRGWNFVGNNNNPVDNNGHGTHVAGIIAALGNNGIGVTGICWRAKIVPLKAFNSDGAATEADLVEALSYANANNIKIINNSFGGLYGYCSGERREACISERFPIYKQAVENIFIAGKIIIAASGNENNDLDTSVYLPVSFGLFYDNIVSVSAINISSELAPFSNYGQDFVDIAAPGAGVLSTLPNNQYGSLSGTSMAAPHVTGGIGLLWSMYPGSDYREIIDTVLSSSDPIVYGSDSRRINGGKLNIGKAIHKLWCQKNNNVPESCKSFDP